MPEDINSIITVVRTPKIASTFSSCINLTYQHLKTGRICLRVRWRD